MPTPIACSRSWRARSPVLDELLTEQGILGDKVGFAARQVHYGAEHNRITGGLSEMEEGLIKEQGETHEQLGEKMKEGDQVG